MLHLKGQERRVFEGLIHLPKRGLKMRRHRRLDDRVERAFEPGPERAMLFCQSRKLGVCRYLRLHFRRFVARLSLSDRTGKMLHSAVYAESRDLPGASALDLGPAMSAAIGDAVNHAVAEWDAAGLLK